MVIPEKQLETWTNQGAVTSAQKAHESIRAALAAQTSPIKDMNVDIFLQGSYRNFTNIYGDSDVDVVVKFKDGTTFAVAWQLP
jgi:tRNA nucleotidyltransferase (CCA-adding enzyme)